MIRASSPTRNSAGQTRLPTFSITSRSSSSSGRSPIAERTMFASRWHSPPNPDSVLSWTTGTCSAAIRSASMLPWTSPSSTPARTPSRPASAALEQRRLAGARGAHQVDHRDARVVEVVAVGAARSSGWRRARRRRPSPWCDALLLLARFLDLDRLDLELVAADDLGVRRARRPGSGTPAAHGPSAVVAVRRGSRSRVPLVPAGVGSASSAGDRSRARARRPRRRCRGRRSRSRSAATRARPGAGRRPGRRPGSPGGRRRGAARCRRSRWRSRARASARRLA